MRRPAAPRAAERRGAWGRAAAAAAARWAAPAALVAACEALSLEGTSVAGWGREVVEGGSRRNLRLGEPWQPVTQGQGTLRTFGEARYPDDRPSGTWEDFEELGRLGAPCTPGRSVLAQCGEDLVCRQGICRRCIQDNECPSLHICEGANFGNGHCEKVEAKAWERAFTDPYEGLCTFMIFFASALAAAAGTGGGGMFVPLLVSLSSLKAENAVPLSQAMILCGSIINLSVFLSTRHPDVHEQPVIDYDCVVLMEPMLCLGVMLGVLMNQISPQWLLLFLLILSLGLALYRTATKGIKQFRAEYAMSSTPAASPASASALVISPRSSSSPRGRHKRSCFDYLVSEDFLELTDKKAWQVILTVAIWLTMLASSFHGLAVCSWAFFRFLCEISAGLVFCTYLAGKHIQRLASDSSDSPCQDRGAFDWTSKGPFHFPMVAFGAGMLGGLLGIGGGMIMSPVLVEVGMHSEAVQATTAMFVFLSSSLATIQFVRLKQLVWHYALWYGSVTVLATAIGQKICDIYIRKQKRYSLITLAISGVLLASLSALVFIGFGQVVEDFYMGRQMWFATDGLCNKGGGGIIAVDVAPADSWPSDLPRYQHRFL